MFDFNHWNRKQKFDGKYFSDILSSGEIEYLIKYSTNSAEWNRRNYNNMDGREQDIFEEKFYKPKMAYGFHTVSMEGSSWFNIPKNVFEMVKNKYPVFEKDYYVKKHEYI